MEYETSSLTGRIGTIEFRRNGKKVNKEQFLREKMLQTMAKVSKDKEGKFLPRKLIGALLSPRK